MAQTKGLKEIELLTDEPIGGVGTLPDGLGFKKYAKVLAGAARGTGGPFTIGIFGDWGTGKTSLMRMIESQLLQDNRGELITVWFNAWRFEMDEHPIIPLVATIIRAMESNQRFMDKLGETGKRLVRTLRAVAYGFSAKAKINVPGFAEIEAGFVAKDMIERDDKLAADPLLDRSLYFQAFDRLSKIDTGTGAKIVILIDDLDRCFPDRAIKLLESIKLVLCQPGFIFILGVARNILEGYLNFKYRREFGISSLQGGAYLDKIVQLPFYIPPHSERIKHLWEKLLERVPSDDKENFRKLLPIAKCACGGNPRTAVRFINNLLIDQEINERQIPISFFAITRGLQQRWADIFDILESSAELRELIVQWCSKRKITIGKEADEQTKKVGETLAIDHDLQEMLYSNEGVKWLQDDGLRNAATQFLQTQRATIEIQTKQTQLSDLLEESYKTTMDELDVLKKQIVLIERKIKRTTSQGTRNQLKSRLQEAKSRMSELQERAVEDWSLMNSVLREK